MRIEESGIIFDFGPDIAVQKFDETGYYQNYFKKMTGAKGVDFVLISNDTLLFIEVKNCSGHESDNRWRIVEDNRKRNTTATIVNTEDRDSLDIEIPQKLAMTLACLCGVHSQPLLQTHSSVLKSYFDFIKSQDISLGNKKIKIILFLEGNFSTKTMTQKMIMSKIGRSLKKKLSWLNCKVIVENTDSQSYRYYNANMVNNT